MSALMRSLGVSRQAMLPFFRCHPQKPLSGAHHCARRRAQQLRRQIGLSKLASSKRPVRGARQRAAHSSCRTKKGRDRMRARPTYQLQFCGLSPDDAAHAIRVPPKAACSSLARVVARPTGDADSEAIIMHI